MRFSVYLLRLVFPTFSLIGALASLHAQTAPATRAIAAGDEAIVLSPFEIKEGAENEWDAKSTLLGNRTNQELVKVPVSVDVLTKSFMDDIGAFSMEDAAAFSAGLTVAPRLESRNDNGRITFRGLSGSNNTSRNFFQWSVPSDTYNVERFDVGKGSNSQMFGDSTPGGQIMTTTKRARLTNFNEALAYYDDLGGYRFQLDVNRKITRQLGIRVNGVNRLDGSYIDGSYQRFRAIDFAVTYRPFRDTVISIDAERGQYQRRRADNSVAIRNIAAPGRGFATNNRWYYTSDGEIIQRTSTTPAANDRVDASGTAVSLLEGQTVGVRLPDGSQKLFSGFDRKFNILGVGDYLDRPYNVVTAMLEQNIGKLSIQASYNQQFQHQDRNDNSFGGSATPPVLSVDGAGRPYVDMSGSLTTYKIFGNTFKAGRVSASYPFEFGKWMKQNVVLTATRSKDYAINRRFGLANTAAAGSAANNGIQFRAYLDDPTILNGNGWNRFNVDHLPTTPTFQPTIVESYVNTGPFIDIRYTRNLTASISGEYLDGKLTSLIGITNNRLSRKIPIASTYATDARGFITFYKTPEESPESFQYDQGFSLSATSYLYGLSYEVIKKPNFSSNIYAIYSQSFNWQSQLTFDGINLGPINGITHEVGFKGDMFGSKISYSAAVYDIKRENAGFPWTPNTLSSTQLEDLFNPNNLLPSDPAFFHVTTGLNNEARTVNSTEKSKGFELNLTAVRVYGIQARLSFSKNSVLATRDLSAFKKLLDAAVARTAAANAPGGDITQAESATFIANAQDILLSNTNINVVTGRRSAPYTGSFVLDYAVEKIAGLRLGLTGVWTPDYNVAILSGLVFRGGASLPLNLYAIYDCKIFRQRTTFRLGLNNVYDLLQGDSKYYKTGGNSLNAATGLPYYVYRYVDPFGATFSATVKF